ncbi:MAG: right-handed parallel beta-helix repeat-containing protein [Gemmatimonadales bacterium]
MAISWWLYVVASLVPLGGCLRAQARETRGPLYYVSPAGSDRGAGSAASPFRTIQRAAQAAGPGDTVIVRPGVYSGPDRIVSLEKSGTATAWITFRAQPTRAAILDGRKGQSLEGWYFGSGVGYVRIEGFEIRDLKEHGFDTYGGGVHDLMIVANHVHHIGRYCTDTSNGRTGASLGAGTRRVTFDGNLWHDIGRFAPGEQGCSPKTQYYQNHDHGIYVADADDVTIRNNVFYNFGRGWAIHRYFSGGAPSHGLVILNNTFVGQNPYRPGQIILATPTEDLRIENNIFHSPQTAALYFEDIRFPRSVVRYNLVSAGRMKVGRPSGISIEHNWEWTDPRFIGPIDFRLRPDSPAIDAGMPLSEVSHDADGVPRPRGRGYDLGAYER